MRSTRRPERARRRRAPARERIGWWRRELERCFDGGTPESEQGRALVPLIARFNLPRRPFDALIEGVEMDLGNRRYETFADLYEYCIRVASAVGLDLPEHLRNARPRRRSSTPSISGVALQLTNILRDVPVDLAQGRLYLPLEDLRAHGCSEADLRAEMAGAGGGVRSSAVQGAAAPPGGAGARLLRAAPRGRCRGANARRLVAAEIMGAIYRALLRRIERERLRRVLARRPRSASAARGDCRGDLGADRAAAVTSRRRHRHRRRICRA